MPFIVSGERAWIVHDPAPRATPERFNGDRSMLQFWSKMRTPTLTYLGLLALSSAARAEPAGVDSGDTAWVLTATALVLFMTLPGLAAFYGGLVRTKNVLSVFMQCVTITAVVSVLWVAYGYSLAFSDGGAANALIGGLGKSFFAGIHRDSVTGHLPETVYAMFQLTFAIITQIGRAHV